MEEEFEDVAPFSENVSPNDEIFEPMQKKFRGPGKVWDFVKSFATKEAARQYIEDEVCYAWKSLCLH